MAWFDFPSIETFETKETTSKQQALKVLEEAAELVEAVKQDRNPASEFTMMTEAADVLQATANLCAYMGWIEDDIRAAYMAVNHHNHTRGRYEIGDTND